MFFLLRRVAISPPTPTCLRKRIKVDQWQRADKANGEDYFYSQFCRSEYIGGDDPEIKANAAIACGKT